MKNVSFLVNFRKGFRRSLQLSNVFSPFASRALELQSIQSIAVSIQVSSKDLTQKNLVRISEISQFVMEISHD